jgi:hypothetical protein
MKQQWVRATKGHDKGLDDFWDLTEREYMTYVLAYLEEEFDKDSRQAQLIQHIHGAFGQDPPSWARIMGLQHTEYDPAYVSKEEFEKYSSKA